MKNHAGAKLAAKFWAVLVALVVCAGFAPATALADEGSGKATLTVIAGSVTDWGTGTTSYDTWVNAEYDFVEGATVADLLEAAKAAGDISGYNAPASAYGMYLTSITSKEGVEQAAWNKEDGSLSLYWNTMKDGVPLSGSIDSEVLADGAKYQIVWNSYSSVSAPSDAAAWDAYYADNAPANAAADKAVLTIIAGSMTDWSTGSPVVSYTTWLNHAYPIVEGATVADLLEAAKAAGDISGYNAPASAYGMYLTSITSKEGVEQAAWNKEDGSLSLYWNTMKDGVPLSGSIDSEVLADGAKYQIVWNSYSSVSAPSDAAAWDAYYAENVPGASTGIADGGAEATPPVDTNVADEVDAQQILALMHNISASFAGTSDAWSAMSLAAMGKADSVDKNALISQALAEMKSTDSSVSGYTTRFQRNIIGLSALGVDCTEIPDGSGVFNAVEEMAKVVTNSTIVNVKIFTLMAYASGDYDVPAAAVLSESALVASVLGAQHADGGYAFYGSDADPDMTAMAIAALAPYRAKYANVENAVNRALNALKSLQNEDGGFGDASVTGSSSEGSNSNSTAAALVALAAVGIDPAKEWATTNGSTPMSALLSYATADLKAFTYEGAVNAMATEQGLRALAAYQGLVNTGSDYDIYVQASKGEAAPPSTPGGEGGSGSEGGSGGSDTGNEGGSAGSGTGSDAGAGSESGSGNTGSADGLLSSTGDSAEILAVAAAIAALCSGTALIACGRMSRTREDAVVR